jgi:hypothetical protein
MEEATKSASRGRVYRVLLVLRGFAVLILAFFEELLGFGGPPPVGPD